MSAEAPRIQTLAELEADHIRAVLALKAGNLTQAAKALGIERRTMYRKCRRLGLSGRGVAGNGKAPRERAA